MRKLLLGLFSFAAIGLGAATMQSAEAQPYYHGYRHAPAYGHGYRPVRGPYYHPYRGRGYAYGRRYRPYYGPGYYRPAYVAPRCFVRYQRVWNGWAWINQPVRVCR